MALTRRLFLLLSCTPLLAACSAIPATPNETQIAQAVATAVAKTAQTATPLPPTATATAQPSSTATVVSAIPTIAATPIPPAPTLSTATKQLSELVLALEDLSAGFKIDIENEVAPEDAAKNAADPQAALEEYKQQGRLKSYFRRFAKDATLNSLLNGPLAISNQVIQYKDAAGARRGRIT